jgi:hypothetical protein
MGTARLFSARRKVGVKTRRRYVVQQSRNSPYVEPITLAKGQVVSFGEEYRGKESWVGWIWCETGTTRCWVPFQLIENCGPGRGIVRESYVATELNVEVGNILESERELNGWVWAMKPGTTESGWVPMDLLVEDSE